MAFGRLKGEPASRWWSHFATCSPCTREFAGFNREAKRRRALRVSVIAACVLIAIGLVLWIAVLNRRAGQRTPDLTAHQTSVPFQPHVLDMREGSALRGGSPQSNRAPLELPRLPLELSIYLPTGTEPAEFEIAVAQNPEHPFLTAGGSAALVDHITVLTVKLDLRSLAPGLYLVMIREKGGEWNYSPVIVR